MAKNAAAKTVEAPIEANPTLVAADKILTRATRHVSFGECWDMEANFNHRDELFNRKLDGVFGTKTTVGVGVTISFKRTLTDNELFAVKDALGNHFFPRYHTKPNITHSEVAPGQKANSRFTRLIFKFDYAQWKRVDFALRELLNLKTPVPSDRINHGLRPVSAARPKTAGKKKAKTARPTAG